MERRPVLKEAASLVCLVLIAAIGAASGATAQHKFHPRSHRRVVDNFDPAKYDDATNDDPIVRQIALNALGHERGTVVAVDPSNGRILAIVDQKMAFSEGFEPCSTIKPFVAIAGLQEGVISRDTMIRVGRRRYMDLTEAMAHSNNKFFEEVGSQLGFARVVKYDRQFGLGERVGFNIPEEQPGLVPSAPPAFGGVARMSSFGEGIRITPFQLASLAAMLANGGTQYYLQYPRTGIDRENFTPRVRQQFDIAPILPDLRDGMLAAVLYGTARRSYDPDGEQDLGKTGTCNDESLGGHLGWFVSYADQAHPRIVIVVLLHGGSRVINGPHASEIAGRIYRGLYAHNFFAQAEAYANRSAQYASSSSSSANSQ